MVEMDRAMLEEKLAAMTKATAKLETPSGDPAAQAPSIGWQSPLCEVEKSGESRVQSCVPPFSCCYLTYRDDIGSLVKGY